MIEYQRWIAFALAPKEYPLSEEDNASFVSPTRHHRVDLTHQLLALLILRDRGQVNDNHDELIDTLCDRIASECAWDFRVTDLYLQRVAFLLAAERDDLIKRRWVERILANQQPNGGFLKSWYGLGPGRFEVRFGKAATTRHATVQGVWILVMLKNRFPGWMDTNFPK